MLVVTVEEWHQGDPRRRETIAVGVIANDLTGSNDLGNYTVHLGTPGEQDPGVVLTNPSRQWRVGGISGFPRRHPDLGVWDLLAQCLLATVGHRRGTGISH